MADGIVPDEDGATAMRFWLQRPIVGILPWLMILWEGDTVPDAGTVFGDLTEPTWSGYGRVPLDRELWNDPVIVAGCAEMTWGAAPYTWDCSSSNVTPVAGWAIYDNLVGVLRYVQRFADADQLTPTVGVAYKLLPRVTQTNAPC